MNLKTIIFTLTLLAGFSACQKENPLDPNQSGGGKVNKSTELSVPNDFDWRTQHQVSVLINPNQSGILQILGSDGILLYKGMAIAGQQLNIPLAIPAAENQIEVVFKGQREMLSTTSVGIITSKVK